MSTTALRRPTPRTFLRAPYRAPNYAPSSGKTEGGMLLANVTLLGCVVVGSIVTWCLYDASYTDGAWVSGAMTAIAGLGLIFVPKS